MNVIVVVARCNSVHDYLVETARSAPSQTALIVPGGVSLGHGALVAAMDAVGVRLSMLDLTRHDRVALILPPGADFLTHIPRHHDARGPLAEPIAPLVAARLRQHLLSAG